MFMLLGACVEASAVPHDAGVSASRGDAAGSLASAADGEVEARDSASEQKDDAGHVQTEAAIEPPVVSPPVCSKEQVGSCPSNSFAVWHSLLDAADFGPEAEFVAIGGQAVLVKTGDGSFRVALLPYPDDAAGYTAWPLVTGARTPIAVSDTLGLSDPHNVFVVACTPAGADCSVLQAEWGRVQASGSVQRDMELSAFHELPPLPTDFAAKGLVIDRNQAAGRNVPCVYGDGLLCFDQDAWLASVPPSAALRLNAVAIGGRYSLAVGDHGRWFKRQWVDGAESRWTEQTPLADIALSEVGASDQGGVILGQGRIQAVIGAEAQAAIPCTPASPLLKFWFGPDRNVWGLVMTSAGELLRHGPVIAVYQLEPYCAYDRVPSGATLGTSYWTCGLSRNARVLKARAVWGTNSCPIE
jgi:hypothetical protein